MCLKQTEVDLPDGKGHKLINIDDILTYDNVTQIQGYCLKGSQPMLSIIELKIKAEHQKSVFKTLRKLPADNLHILDYLIILSIADLTNSEGYCFAAELKDHEFLVHFSRPTIQRHLLKIRKLKLISTTGGVTNRAYKLELGE